MLNLVARRSACSTCDTGPETFQDVGAILTGPGIACWSSMPANFSHLECEQQTRLERRVQPRLKYFLLLSRARILVYPRWLKYAAVVLYAWYIPIGVCRIARTAKCWSGDKIALTVKYPAPVRCLGFLEAGIHCDDLPRCWEVWFSQIQGSIFELPGQR